MVGVQIVVFTDGERLFDVTQHGRAIALAERFGVPPFTILDTKAGPWRARRQMWLDTGLASLEGRTARTYNMDTGSYPGAVNNGVSIFDPVLCELMLRWWSKPGHRVLDPFAGGSVRGIVAGALGRRYVGIDLSAAQVQANQAQLALPSMASLFSNGCAPVWVVGDSSKILPQLSEGMVDFLFTCPPYYDLEQYSTDPEDLSNMPWENFVATYKTIWTAAGRLLAVDRFAAVVIGEVRDKVGVFRNLVGLTIEAMAEGGMHYYNTAILATAAASAAIRAPAQFENSRKLCMTHQHLLVFVKGDPKKATAACGHVDMRSLGWDAEE